MDRDAVSDDGSSGDAVDRAVDAVAVVDNDKDNDPVMNGVCGDNCDDAGSDDRVERLRWPDCYQQGQHPPTFRILIEPKHLHSVF